MRITESGIRQVVREEARKLMGEAAPEREQQDLDAALQQISRLYQVGIADLFEQEQPPHESYYEGKELIKEALKRVEHRLMVELADRYSEHVDR